MNLLIADRMENLLYELTDIEIEGYPKWKSRPGGGKRYAKVRLPFLLLLMWGKSSNDINNHNATSWINGPIEIFLFSR